MVEAARDDGRHVTVVGVRPAVAAVVNRLGALGGVDEQNMFERRLDALQRAAGLLENEARGR